MKIRILLVLNFIVIILTPNFNFRREPQNIIHFIKCNVFNREKGVEYKFCNIYILERIVLENTLKSFYKNNLRNNRMGLYNSYNKLITLYI